MSNIDTSRKKSNASFDSFTYPGGFIETGPTYLLNELLDRNQKNGMDCMIWQASKHYKAARQIAGRQ